MEEQQWYTNKELFKLINDVQMDFKDLRSEMRETRNIIKGYNGLREELGKSKDNIKNISKDIQEVNKELEIIVAKKEERHTVGKLIREWGGWVFGLITLIFMFLG